MARPQGLQRRPNGWYLRVAIPEKLRHLFDGKVQIFRPLGTTDYAEACTLVRDARAAAEAELERVRRIVSTIAEGKSVGATKPVAHRVSLDGLRQAELGDDELQQLVRQHLRGRLASSRTEFLAAGSNEGAFDLVPRAASWTLICATRP